MDDLGRVLALNEEELIFPVPVVLNVAGYCTAAGDANDTLPRTSATEAPQIMDGMEKQFDRQATLKPEKSMAVAAKLPNRRTRSVLDRQRKQNRRRTPKRFSHAF